LRYPDCVIPRIDLRGDMPFDDTQREGYTDKWHSG